MQVSQPQKKLQPRRVIDYKNSLHKWSDRLRIGKPMSSGLNIKPDAAYVIDLLAPAAYKRHDIVNTPSKFVHLSMNKVKQAVTSLAWTPDGRRLVSANQAGEFTLWHGFAFNFETIMQAHDSAIRATVYSHNQDWLISADVDGVIKYWQPNFNNVKIIADGHTEAINQLAFSPQDSRFVSCSDDHNIKIWNFTQGVEEQALTGHGWDVKCADWHPSKGLIVSGSKDNLVKLWDPRAPASCIATLHSHKGTVNCAQFQPTRGDLLATAGRDHSARIFDIRAMKELYHLRGNEKDIMSLTWHPVNTQVLSTGSYEGRICHYNLDSYQPMAEQGNTLLPYHIVPYGHDAAILCMQYHPIGHVFSTGSHDRFIRFWIRGRPADPAAFKDRYYLGQEEAERLGYQGNGVNTPLVPTNNASNMMVNGGQDTNDMDDDEYMADAIEDQDAEPNGTIPSLNSNQSQKNDTSAVMQNPFFIPGLSTSFSSDVSVPGLSSFPNDTSAAGSAQDQVDPNAFMQMFQMFQQQQAQQ
ncbi:hypothetical protein CANCADRAFT_31618 [Tortispora caseinolytica NRRL Y-17796]|uniref:Polyadenylation factor subunit 2 n=1 Tax=Tortispora caseinolytica NRRL Y-17796 TaxID=767744 RepID=A0A1E4TG51_9ASCO|nr:hypothetical protein CANCADRAFT_31618 [Tortispora caseinolytica NRRL Y-17796]